MPSVLQVADRQIHDAESHGDENLSVADILRVSSNIGADEIGMKVGASRFDYWVHRFGFGAPTGVDLPGEERGIVLHASQYSGSSMGNLPIGQGESVTPIQIATAYAAIANGGILRPAAHRRRGRRQADQAARRARRSSPRPPPPSCARCSAACSPTAAPRPGAAIPGYDLAGKTGTAQTWSSTASTPRAQYIASFIGFVPASHPRLLVAVMVDEPQGSIYGGSVAAPGVPEDRRLGGAVPRHLAALIAVRQAVRSAPHVRLDLDPRGSRRLLVVALSTLGLLPSAGRAAVGDVIPPSNPVANQYVESVPTAGGGRQLGIGAATHPNAGRGTGVIAPVTAAGLIRQGSDGVRAATLATASAPAPVHGTPRVRPHAPLRAGSPAHPPSAAVAGGAGDSPFGSVAASLVGSSSGGFGVAFPVALVLLAVGAGASGLRRRRTR